MNRNKFKFLVFFGLILAFYYVFHICFKDESLSNVDFDSLVYNENLITGLYVDNSLCSYDSNTGIYYSNSDKLSNISFNSIYGHLDYTFSSMSNNIYSVYVYNNDYFYKFDLVVTDIPLVNIYSLDIEKHNPYSVKDFRSFSFLNEDSSNTLTKPVSIYINNILQNNGRKSFTSSAVMSQRGASSTFFEKKAYKIEMDKRFGMYGLKDDNIWVLDALVADPSKVRNKLSSDLWNLVNDNQSINNDLNSKFVEVFIDNEYRGLYVLKDKVDSGVTSISSDGLLMKAVGHLNSSAIDRLIDNKYSSSDTKVMNFEVKKSNDETLDEFLRIIRNYYINNKSYESTVNAFDLNNYLNYKIFVAFIAGEDNVTSNQYYSMVNADSKVLITPWDMDLTWGSYWNINRQILSEFLWDRDFSYEWLESTIFDDLDEKTMSLMKDRYWELRKSVLNMDTINSYLDSYDELLVESGAAKRDSERWFGYDVDFEIDRIREWAEKRLIFLDEYFK